MNERATLNKGTVGGDGLAGVEMINWISYRLLLLLGVV